tara:strand:+ start:97 stop:1932 length:1836 start_codon:yes stop_codon:yes gene_type:complete
MCGLVALLGTAAGAAAPALTAMSADLLHRGPDSSGHAYGDNWALGFRRLSILAPGTGADQPMRDDEAGLSLVFNGEIYNFRALRSELEARGVQFRSGGDTEVVLRGYQVWGADVLDRLEGMFALVLVDTRRGIALVARDPLGIKPLYIRYRAGLVAVASEVRPLRHLAPLAVDEVALAELLTFGWAAGEVSNYAGVRRLRGGMSLTVDLASATVKERRYCDPLLTLEPRDVTEAQVEQALNESIGAHTVSDVGYSLQLSGGVDSSYIAARIAGTAQHAVRSYAVRIPNYDQDEQAYRSLVLERCALEHEEVEMDGQAFADALPRAISHMEGPVPHGGCVMLMLLCERIRAEHKVVLTGEGADEMFGGYRRYGDWRRLRWQEWLSRLPFAGRLPNKPPFMGVHRIAGLDMPSYASVYHDWRAMRSVFPGLLPTAGGDRRRVSAQFSDFRDRLFAVDQSAYLESLLVRQDKMSMAASVEARVPFVHMPLLRLVNGMSRDVRLPGGETKPVLKRFARKYLPGALVDRRKIGLLLPYQRWFGQPTALGRYLDLLTEPNARLAAFAEPGALARAVSGLRAGQTEGLPSAWMLVNTELWLRSLSDTALNTSSSSAAS